MSDRQNLPCRCGNVVTIEPTRAGATALWLVQAPGTQGGSTTAFDVQKIETAHRLHECGKCRRLLFIDHAGMVETLQRNT